MSAIQIPDLNNGKTDLDFVAEFVNSTEPIAIDRLGRNRRTLKGVEVVLDAKVAVVESATAEAVGAIEQKVNDVEGVVVAAVNDAVGVTAESAAAVEASRLEYEDRVYPGVYSSPPTHRPRSGVPCVDGDRCVILVAGVAYEHLRSGGGWLIPNIDAAHLASAAGSLGVGYRRDSAAILRGVGKQLDHLLNFYEYMSDDEIAAAKAKMGHAGPVMTDSMQTCIDKNKGYRITAPEDGLFHAAGLFMEGSTYRGTEIDFKGPLMLRARPVISPPTPGQFDGVYENNFGGAWCGLVVRGVPNVILHAYGDGNFANQPDEEHNYVFGFAGNTDIYVPLYRVQNVRGDGGYVSQYNWQANSAQSRGFRIGKLLGVNPTDSGRNILSVISCDDMEIDLCDSYGIGGKVGGVFQPGGLDFEPNELYHSCKNIVVNTVRVVHGGTSGLAIHGKRGDLSTPVSSDITIKKAYVVNRVMPTDEDGNHNFTQTKHFTLKIASTVRAKVLDFRGEFTNAYGDGISVSDSIGCKVYGEVQHVREGLRIGNDALDDTGGGVGVIDSDFNVNVKDVSRFGQRTGKITRTKVRGNVSSPAAGYYSALFGVVSFTHPQADCEYGTSVAPDPAWTRSYRNDPSTPATYSNTVIANCDLSGPAAYGATAGSWAAFTNQVGDMPVRRVNVRGVTDRPSIPSIGSNLWVTGQEFVNNSATAAGAATGWRYNGATMVPAGHVSTASPLPTYAATGAPLRTFDVSSVTLPQLGQVVAAIVTDLRARGLII